MTSRSRHRLAASVLVVAIGTACGGGTGASRGASRDARARARTAAPAVAAPAPHPSTTQPTAPTTTAPTATSGSARAPAPAAPFVLDRGGDHVAIARSLVEYGRWLERFPARADVRRAYAPGSALAGAMGGEVTRMRRMHRHIVEVDRAPLDFVVLSALPNVVSFRLTEQLASRELVAADGRVLRHDPAATERYIVSIMRFAPDAPWRLNVVDRQGPPIEVRL